MSESVVHTCFGCGNDVTCEVLPLQFRYVEEVFDAYEGETLRVDGTETFCVICKDLGHTRHTYRSTQMRKFQKMLAKAALLILTQLREGRQ